MLNATTFPVLDEPTFQKVREFLLRSAGITLGAEKRSLVVGRLSKRLNPSGCDDFRSYVALVTGGHDPDETQRAIDLLTTNETHFFREPTHFDALREFVAQRPASAEPLRVWSAACSSGEEPYTIAMVLADVLGIDAPWEVLASDLSTRILDHARTASYGPDRIAEIPNEYLKRYCLKGIGSQAGRLMIDKPLRQHVSFRQINLNQPLPDIGKFDVIFLRNVMIYFNPDTKRQVVARISECLASDGWFIVGHSESLQGYHDGLRSQRPTIYRWK